MLDACEVDGTLCSLYTNLVNPKQIITIITSDADYDPLKTSAGSGRKMLTA